MKMYTEFDIEKLIDTYKVATPDYEVYAIKVNDIVAGTLKSRRDIIFKKDNKTLTLAQAIPELDLQAPDEILSQI